MNSEVSVAIVSGIVTIICATFTGITNWLTSRRTKKLLTDKKQDARLDKLENAMLCLLRDQLIGTCEECIEQGYCQMYVRDNIAHAYETYHSLGGNGAITSLYEKVMELDVPKAEQRNGGNENEN